MRWTSPGGSWVTNGGAFLSRWQHWNNSFTSSLDLGNSCNEYLENLASTPVLKSSELQLGALLREEILQENLGFCTARGYYDAEGSSVGGIAIPAVYFIGFDSFSPWGLMCFVLLRSRSVLFSWSFQSVEGSV